MNVRVKRNKTKAKAVTMTRKKQPQRKAKAAEISFLGKALRGLGGLGGGALGGMLGQSSAGSALGTGLGAAISRWLGAGDYTVQQNSVVQSSLRASNSIPMMHNTGQTITVRHKEFIATINGSSAFQVQRFFVIQPGDQNTFPWMSGVASKFQQYRIKGMVFHYVPTSGYAVSGANPAIGSVMMQTSYRANDNPPTSKVEMLNEYWASESSPAETFCHPIECSPQENPFSIHYVRNNAIVANDSPLLYDLGVTYVATQGMQSSGNPVGDLWVTYEVELSKPIVASSVIDNTSSALLSSTTGITSTNPLGTLTLSASGQTLPITVTGGKTIQFPTGRLGDYMVTIAYSFSGALTNFNNSLPSVTYANCAALAVNSAGESSVGPMVGGGGAVSQPNFIFGVRLADPSVTASVTLGTFAWTAGTPAAVYITITSF